MEINVVTLHKVVETMPQQMHSVFKAKGGLLQKASVQIVFGTGSVFFFCHHVNGVSGIQFWFNLTIALSSSHNYIEVWQTPDAWFCLLCSLCHQSGMGVPFYCSFWDMVTPICNSAILKLWSLGYLWPPSPSSLPSVGIICTFILLLASFQPFHMFYTFLLLPLLMLQYVLNYPHNTDSIPVGLQCVWCVSALVLSLIG